MLFELPEKEKTEEEGLKAVRPSDLSKIDWKEKDLENLLANNITQFIREEHLMTIGQESSWKEEPDILALDENATLYIFELKRSQSEPKNLLQVLRYGQKFGVYGYKKLKDIFKKYREDGRTRDLQEEHKRYFDLEDKIPKTQFNEEQKFVIVTDGVDVDTLRAVKYWQEKGLSVEPLTYKIYEIGRKALIDFNPYGGGDELEIAETENHIVNTNISWSEVAYKEMLEKERAASYGNRKTAVDSIQKGDKVFLYHTGVGICAVGRAVGEAKEVEPEEQPEDKEEHFVPCSFRQKIDPLENPKRALTAKEINNELNTNWYFRQTRFSISKEEADKVESMFKKKQREFE